MINHEITMIAIAFLSAVFANLIRLSTDRRLPIDARECKDIVDIVCFLFLFPIIGAFLTLVYIIEGTPLTAFLAMHIGITAPLTISALAGNCISHGESPRNNVKID